MKNKITKITALLTVLAMLISGVAVYVSSAEDAWTFNQSTTGIYLANTVSASDEALMEQLHLFAQELQEKGITDTCLPIYYGSPESAGDSDIVLILDSTRTDIPAQGYEVVISGSALHVSASDADGLFYGCRYVLKQLLANGSVTGVTSSPDVPERGLSLDNGRKYYTVDWIKQMIRELSWADMNTLVLHFSEEMGWGIESKTYDWLAGRDGTLCTQAEVATDNTVLSQAEIAEIVEYAKLYHVDVIPSIDSPGHLNYLVKKFNEKCATEDYSFTYNGKTYTAKAGTNIGNYFSYNGQTTAVVPGSRNTVYSRGIDISNEIAVAFVHSLIEEYGTLFRNLGCTKFDIGGDELLGWGSAVTSSVPKWKQLDHWKAYAQTRTGNSSAVAYDAFLLYMNDLYDLVTGLGYTSVRMWNDDALRSSDTGWTGVVQLNTNIDIWFWTTGTNTVWTYANAGYQVYNILSDYNYYAMTSDYFSSSRGSFTQAYPDQIYNEWTPYTFDPTSTTLGSGGNMAIGNANVLGSAFGIWSDNPTLRTEEQVMSDVLPLLRAHGAKAWDAKCNTDTSYEKFTKFLETIGDCDAPDASDPTVIDLTALESTVAEYDYTPNDAVRYTEATFQAYTAAVDAAKAVLKDRQADQEDVSGAISDILAAYGALEINEDYCLIDSASFRTTRVRSGGTAVMKVSVTGTPQSFTLTDGTGTPVTDFTVVTLPGTENVYYLRFTVTGTGWKSYTVTVNGDSATAQTARVRLWKSAY